MYLPLYLCLVWEEAFLQHWPFPVEIENYMCVSLEVKVNRLSAWMEGMGICEHIIDCCVTGSLNIFPFTVQQMFIVS